MSLFKRAMMALSLFNLFGAFDTAEGTVTLSGGTVYTIAMTNKGHGYVSASDATVAFTAAPTGGTNAEGTAILGEGIVTYVPMSAAGRGYLTPPAVTFTGGGGTGASAVGILGPDGSIVGVRIQDHGKGYTSVPTAAIAAAPTGGTNATLGTVQCAFKITGVTITNAGAGYIAIPIVTFGNPLQAVVDTGCYSMHSLFSVHTLDSRVVASNERVFIIAPQVNADGVVPIQNQTGSIIIQRYTAGTYTVNLRYALSFAGA